MSCGVMAGTDDLAELRAIETNKTAAKVSCCQPGYRGIRACLPVIFGEQTGIHRP